MTLSALINRLRAEPEAFEFFQAVTILERVAARDRDDAHFTPTSRVFDAFGGSDESERENPLNNEASSREPVGHDSLPRREVVRFRAEQTRGFPGTEIVAFTPADANAPPEMTVSFLGLTGASGVLPLHYTDAVIEHTRRNKKNPALRDFFDIINHRAISLFYRAWVKYRLPASYLLAPSNADDPITAALFALIGFGTPGLRARFDFDDKTLLRYAGLLSHRPRSAVGLEAMLSDDLGQPVTLEQFRGGWIPISPDEQTRLPDRADPNGRFCRLGVDAVIGDRVWDVQGGFRLRLGPLRYHDFLDVMPDGGLQARIAQLTRLYVGPDMSFDLQVVLAKEEVPFLRLGDVASPKAPRLGWNTWLKGADFTHDADDATFSFDHITP